MADRASRVPGRSRGQRTARLIAGIGVAGVGFALTLRSRLGLGPWHVVQQGLSEQTGLTVGTAVVIVNAILVLVALWLRERPGLGTLAVVALLGPSVDGSLLVIPDTHSAVLRVAALLGGLVVMSSGGALVISARLGVSPLDSVMIGAFRRLHAASLSGIRLVMEAAGLGLGWTLGGTIGIGTLVIGLGIGPILHGWLHVMGAVPEKETLGLPS
ncbi:MAG: hypothetical protein HYU28_11540 [Actinobacteria bacterium]|nr:hypothetical protein [Actinomycetota bacterium]